MNPDVKTEANNLEPMERSSEAASLRAGWGVGGDMITLIRDTMLPQEYVEKSFIYINYSEPYENSLKEGRMGEWNKQYL